jgi:hypothetical protein
LQILRQLWDDPIQAYKERHPMKAHRPPYRVLISGLFLARLAWAQQPPPAPSAQPPVFYRKYEIQPVGNGEKVLIRLENGVATLNIIAEPVTPKDGGPVTQYAVYFGGGVTLYTKTFLTLPDPNGGEGAKVDGISVTQVIAANAVVARPAAAPSAHQSSSQWTTPPHKSKDFKMPIRFEKVGPGMGRARTWLLWDGKTEIQVEPVSTSLGSAIRDIVPTNHLKFLSNVYTQGSPAPRYFYFKRNKDDSITVYGDDDIEKLKAIDKGKGK